MKKSLALGAVLLISPLFVFSEIVKVSNIHITEKIKNELIGPSININFKKISFDVTADFVTKTGHINVDLYPAYAEISPYILSSFIKGRENFNVKKYKTITFRSTKLNFTSDKQISSVAGILTVKGISTPVEFKKNAFKCKSFGKGRICNIDYIASLDRTKIGITSGVKLGLSKQGPVRLIATFSDSLSADVCLLYTSPSPRDS